MDFSAVFQPVPIPDFADVFPVRVSVAQHWEYLVEEPELDIWPSFPPPFTYVHNPSPVGLTHVTYI